MFQFFLCNLTDTCSFVAERIYEYHTNILLVVLMVMVIVMGGLYFTYIFIVKNIVTNVYTFSIFFQTNTLISLYEKGFSSGFKKLERVDMVISTQIKMCLNFIKNRIVNLIFKLSWMR